MPCNNVESVKIVADWQIWGDVDPESFLNELLKQALEEGKITAYTVPVISEGGPFGLKYAVMVVKANFHFDELQRPKKSARRLLNEIVHDSDVKVRWVVPG